MTELIWVSAIGVLAGVFIGSIVGFSLGRRIRWKTLPGAISDVYQRCGQAERMLSLQTRRADLAEQQLAMLTTRN